MEQNKERKNLITELNKLDEETKKKNFIESNRIFLLQQKVI